MNIKLNEIKRRMTVYFEQELKEGNFLEIQDPYVCCLSSFSKFAIAAEVVNPRRQQKRDGRAVMYWTPVENKWCFSNSICIYPRYKTINQYVPKVESKYLKLEILNEDEIALDKKENYDFPNDAEEALLKLQAYALTAEDEWEHSLFWKRGIEVDPALIDREIPGYLYFEAEEDNEWKHMLVNDGVQLMACELFSFLKVPYDIWYTGQDGWKRKYYFDGKVFILKEVEPLSVSRALQIAQDLNLDGFAAYGQPVPVRDSDDCYWLIGALRRGKRKVLVNVRDGRREIFSDAGFAKQFYVPEPKDPSFVYD